MPQLRLFTGGSAAARARGPSAVAVAAAQSADASPHTGVAFVLLHVGKERLRPDPYKQSCSWEQPAGGRDEMSGDGDSLPECPDGDGKCLPEGLLEGGGESPP